MLVHDFPWPACQDLSASVSRMHACHFESWPDLIIVPIFSGIMLLILWSRCWRQTAAGKDDSPGTTRSTKLSIIQVSDFQLLANCFIDFPFKWISVFLSKAYEAIEPLAFHRVIALLRTDRNRKQNSCVLVYLHFSLSRLGPLRTFFSRPRAEVTSHHQHVDRGNECHTCICSQTCHHDTPDDADNYMTIFFVLSTIDKEFVPQVAGPAFRLLEFLTSVCSFTCGLKRILVLGEIFFASPTSFHIVSRRPVACVWKTTIVSSWTRPNSLPPKFFLQSSDRCKKMCLLLSFYFEPLRKLLLGNSPFSSEILFGQGTFADASPRRDNSELPCLEYKSQNPHFPPFRLWLALT